VGVAEKRFCCANFAAQILLRKFCEAKMLWSEGEQRQKGRVLDKIDLLFAVNGAPPLMDLQNSICLIKRVVVL
jgi:hypothetical protein